MSDTTERGWKGRRVGGGGRRFQKKENQKKDREQRMEFFFWATRDSGYLSRSQFTELRGTDVSVSVL